MSQPLTASTSTPHMLAACVLDILTQPQSVAQHITQSYVHTHHVALTADVETGHVGAALHAVSNVCRSLSTDEVP